MRSNTAPIQPQYSPNTASSTLRFLSPDNMVMNVKMQIMKDSQSSASISIQTITLRPNPSGIHFLLRSLVFGRGIQHRLLLTIRPSSSSSHRGKVGF